MKDCEGVEAVLRQLDETHGILVYYQTNVAHIYLGFYFFQANTNSWNSTFWHERRSSRVKSLTSRSHWT